MTRWKPGLTVEVSGYNHLTDRWECVLTDRGYERTIKLSFDVCAITLKMVKYPRVSPFVLKEVLDLALEAIQATGE